MRTKTSASEGGTSEKGKVRLEQGISIPKLFRKADEVLLHRQLLFIQDLFEKTITMSVHRRYMLSKVMRAYQELGKLGGETFVEHIKGLQRRFDRCTRF